MYKETLYGLDKNGGVKVWTIETGDSGSSSVIVVAHGALDGVMTQQVSPITEGKQGRTPSEQAINEAKAKVKKQLDRNYRRDIAELTALPLLPMLAADYLKVGHRIDFESGVDASFKLDGLRLLAKCTAPGVIELVSRTGQPYYIPHIEAELAKVMRPGEVLDGEAYLHGEVLQDISSAVKRTDTQAEIDKVQRAIAKKGPDYRKPSKTAGVLEPTLAEELENAELIHQIRPQLQFIVFDVPSDKPWYKRLLDLDEFAECRFIPGGFVAAIKNECCFSEEQMKELHKAAVSLGYEGIMLRNRMGLYESGKRSADLQKYKEFLEAEFQVVDYTVDKEGHVVFICRNDLNGRLFNVIFGTEEEKSGMLAVIGSFLLKYLKVKFQSRYKKTLLPQFPTGVMFRDGKYVDGEFVPSE